MLSSINWNSLNSAISAVAKFSFLATLVCIAALGIATIMHYPLSDEEFCDVFVPVVLLVILYPGIVFALTQIWRQEFRESMPTIRKLSLFVLSVLGIAWFFWLKAGPYVAQKLLQSLS
ncbi:MAG: hypothetical protein HY974_01025 [Candidatus Kerfeldbacteria bacterium]|nr:hypothetical protein [Candidatus Kerfeldbacteria bacterium]